MPVWISFVFGDKGVPSHQVEGDLSPEGVITCFEEQGQREDLSDALASGVFSVSFGSNTPQARVPYFELACLKLH